MNFHEILEGISNEALALRSIELVGVVCALAYVILAARRNIACWWFGLVSSMMYLYICFEAKYYQDIFIHVYYIVMSFVGWTMWRKHKAAKEEIIPRFAGWKLNVFAILAGSVAALISGFIFDRYTDNSYPYVDAFCTMFAFVATWMGTRRHPEHWLIFVAVDFTCIFLYYVKGFYLTSALFVMYTIIAAIAYFSWVKKIRKASAKSL